MRGRSAKRVDEFTTPPVNGRELLVATCGRFLEVKNRRRADPVGGLGGGDRDARAYM
jgi:hypothetical protein